MTGSLQIKKNKYYMVINTTDANGKRKPKWISTGLAVKGNKKRAEQMLRETLREFEQQKKARRPCRGTMFSDWVRHWLYDVASKRVDTVTFEGYENTALTHVIPYFREAMLPLAEVDIIKLQSFIDYKAENGRIDGSGGLSPASIRHIRNILSQSLKLALRDGIIDRNPCDGLVLPKRQRGELSFYNEEQVERLFMAVKNEQLYPVIYFSAMYGLRRSELLGLQWDSIDFRANTFTVKRTVVQHKTITEKEKTKNASSRRTLPLMPEVHSLLLRMKKQEDENRRLFGQSYQENQYIFKWPDGRPYIPHYIGEKFSKLLVKYGLPHIRFHDLRHSCASMLITNDFTLKDIQDWLGHANIAMTADTYGHLDMTRKRKMAESMSGRFGAPR